MTSDHALQRLHDAGVSIWLDTLSRELLDSGAFAALIADCAVTGATSNPTIFAKAITGSDRYDEQLRAGVAAGVRDPQELFFALALDDVRGAADLLRPTYDASGGRDGFVSFECTPDLADDTAGTIEQALELWERLARPNVMIKVPATEAGIAGDRGAHRPRRQRQRHAAVLRRALRAGDRRLPARARAPRRRRASRSTRSPRSPRSSSRASTPRPTPCCPPTRTCAAGWRSPTRSCAYARYRARFAGERWQRAGRAPAPSPQRPLWASTGTKDPAYSDVLYVEELIAPGVVNTMPEATLRAFADHGDADAHPRRDAPPRPSESCAERRARRRRPRRGHRASSSARACRPSATPISSCSTASRARPRTPSSRPSHVGRRRARQCATSTTIRVGALSLKTRNPVLRRSPSPKETTPSKSPAFLTWRRLEHSGVAHARQEIRAC